MPSLVESRRALDTSALIGTEEFGAMLAITEDASCWEGKSLPFQPAGGLESSSCGGDPADGLDFGPVSLDRILVGECSKLVKGERYSVAITVLDKALSILSDTSAARGSTYTGRVASWNVVVPDVRVAGDCCCISEGLLSASTK